MPTSRLLLETPDGVRLEAEHAEALAPAGAVVLAHPHPRYGGDMRTGLVDVLFSSLPAHQISVLRFNFRGVGASTGAHDGGRGERLDVATAVAHLAASDPSLPLLVCGWSFGSVVALDVAPDALRGWVAVAPPLGMLAGRRPAASIDLRPTWVLVPAHDQFCPPAEAHRLTDGWTATHLVELTGTDHFLWGQGGAVARHVIAALGEVGPGKG